MIHLRCGSDIHDALRSIGLVGDGAGRFLEFSDPYCDGPVLGLPRAEFLERRAGFLSASYDLPIEAVRAKLREQYDALDAVATGDEPLTLWFEHDSYDQLILAYMLMRCDAKQRRNVRLISLDRHPVHPERRFRGLGELGPEELRLVFKDHAVEATPQMFAFGASVWSALCAPDPLDLMNLAGPEPERRASDGKSVMQAALRRHLLELPDTAGLSRTERLTLEIVRDLSAKEAPSIATVFQALNDEREPLPYLGDLMFRRVIAAFRNAEVPVLEGAGFADQPAQAPEWLRERVRLTGAGKKLAAGELHYLEDCRPPERYVGGVCVS